MNFNLSKALVLSVASFLAAASVNGVAADRETAAYKETYKENCSPEPVCCPEPKPGPFAYNFPYNAGLACPMDFFVHVDALYWQAREGGLDFGVSTTSALGAATTISNGVPVGFSGDSSDYGYNPGLRAGFTCFLSHDLWNVDINVTWLHVTEAKTRTAPAGGFIYPAWLMPQAYASGGGLAWISARGVWDATVTVVDLDMGKPYQISRMAALNPYFGVRGAWIDQHFSVHYPTGSLAPVSPTGLVHHGDNDFSGVGLRMGTRLCLKMGKGWDLYGNLGGSLLYGSFDVDQNGEATPGTAISAFDLNFDYKEVVPNLDVMLGLRWTALINNQKARVGLAVAYDFQEWWNQLQLKRWYGAGGGTTAAAVVQNETVARGDLSLGGWSLSLQFDL